MSRQGSQRAVRELESSSLLVSGVDVTGAPFQEESQTIDISETGIAFYLKTSVWMDAHLSLEVRSSPSLGQKSLLKAKVVRFGTTVSGKRLVAARFD
jgi:PilZ domain